MYDPDSLRDIPSFGKVPVLILCTEHAHVMCRGGFHAVTRLELYVECCSEEAAFALEEARNSADVTWCVSFLCALRQGSIRRIICG